MSRRPHLTTGYSVRLHALAVAAAACLCACASPDSGPTDEQQAQMHREFANTYLVNGQLAQAEQQADLGLALMPHDTGLRFLKAWALLRRGTPQDVFGAEKLFRELVSTKDYHALEGLGEALERKGVLFWESAQAVESGKRPTQALDPKARVADFRELAQKAWHEAIDCYNKALERKSGEIPAINGLQRTYALLGDFESSLKWSDTLLAQSEGEIAFWKKQLDRPDLTAKDEQRWRSLLSASSKLLVETHMQASTTAFKLGRKEEALAHLDHVVEVTPTNAEAYSRRAQLLKDLGRPKEARESIQEFLRLSTLDIEHPDMKRALDLLTECDLELKKTTQASR
jgi:tetratricopeptide (TPR) repeat protein